MIAIETIQVFLKLLKSLCMRMGSGCLCESQQKIFAWRGWTFKHIEEGYLGFWALFYSNKKNKEVLWKIVCKLTHETWVENRSFKVQIKKEMTLLVHRVIIWQKSTNITFCIAITSPIIACPCSSSSTIARTAHLF